MAALRTCTGGWRTRRRTPGKRGTTAIIISICFSNDGELVYCSDVEGLLQELGCTHNRVEWRLFVDSSKFSLKAVLLHNGNIHPPFPFARCVHRKETYENVDLLFKATGYSKYGWKICGYLKVIGLLQGIQSGYKKFFCFPCEWDSRAKDKHYKIKD